MKKQLARTLGMWGLYALTLWVGFGWFGLPNGFMPMFMNFLGTSVFLGFALWETFIFMGMNDLRKDARDAELEEWAREFGELVYNNLDKHTSFSIPVENGFQFEIFWNEAINMWQGELWDMTTVPVSIVDRDVFACGSEVTDWMAKVKETVNTF
jgi:hypothetical protein